jgi:hypothetical protein
LEIQVGNLFQSSITFCKSGTSYDKQQCLFDKNHNPICFLENNYLTNLLLDIPFETQKYFNKCFRKERVGKIYNVEEDKYILFALGKPVDFKGVYFY